MSKELSMLSLAQRAEPEKYHQAAEDWLKRAFGPNDDSLDYSVAAQMLTQERLTELGHPEELKMTLEEGKGGLLLGRLFILRKIAKAVDKKKHGVAAEVGWPGTSAQPPVQRNLTVCPQHVRDGDSFSYMNCWAVDPPVDRLQFANSCCPS